MKILHLTTVFFLMVVFPSQLTSVAAMIVRYTREPVTKTEGLSLSLKCIVEYKTEECNIDAKWSYTNNNELLPIVDNNRFLITVNETELGTDKHRLRNIFLTISSLKLQDTGLYQCNAECLSSGTEAKGHLLILKVTADPHQGLKVSTWSGQLKADAAALALSIILLLLWCNKNDMVFSV